MNTPTVFIFPNVTLGYGSPEWLRIGYCLADAGYQVRFFEPKNKERPYYYIEGYHRIIVPKWALRSVKFFVLLKSLLSNVIIVTHRRDVEFCVLNKKSTLVYYYSEIPKDENRAAGRINLSKAKKYLRRLFDCRVDHFIAPQEDRLLYGAAPFLNAQKHIVLNTPRKRTGLSPLPEKTADVIQIVYQGQIKKVAQAEKIVGLIRSTKDYVVWHIAGPADQPYEAEIIELSSHANVNYYGFLRHHQLTSLLTSSHLGLISWGNGPGVAHKYAAPNKLFEYVSYGLYVLSFCNYSVMKWNKKYRFGFVSETEKNDEANVEKRIKALSTQPKRLKPVEKNNRRLFAEALHYECQVAPVIKALSKKHKPRTVS